MRKTIANLTVMVLVVGSSLAWADFKYTESSQLTGGMMAGMMKIAGAFNKRVREPVVTTHYLKGNRLRIDQADETAQIIDLEGRRIVNLNLQKRTYSVITFDEMREALEKMQRDSKQKGASVEMTPKIDVTPTKNTRVVLGQTTHEVKVRIEMQMQAKNQEQTQNISFLVNSDMWLASPVKGYEEVQRFNEQMAKELNWIPGVMFGANPQTSSGMRELQKKAATMKGIPLLQYASIGMAGMTQGGSAGASSGQGQSSQAQTSSASANQDGTSTNSPSGGLSAGNITRPGSAVAKGLGGGFGRKKIKQEQSESESAQPEQASTSSATGQRGTGSSSLADMTIEVTSYSTDPLDAALFDIPAGFTQVKKGADQIFGGAHR